MLFLTFCIGFSKSLTSSSRPSAIENILNIFWTFPVAYYHTCNFDFGDCKLWFRGKVWLTECTDGNHWLSHFCSNSCRCSAAGEPWCHCHIKDLGSIRSVSEPRKQVKWHSWHPQVWFSWVPLLPCRFFVLFNSERCWLCWFYPAFSVLNVLMGGTVISS